MDRQTAVPTQSYAIITVDLTIGNDHGKADVPMLERPANSGS